MSNADRSRYRKRPLQTKAADYLLYILYVTIVIHTKWLEGYSTRPRWLPAVVPEKTAAEMKRELRIWGSLLVAIGIVGVIVSGFLDPVWGLILVVFGAAALSIQERSMFVPIGMALLFGGIVNLGAGVTTGELGIWTIFGALMTILGAQEIRKIKVYALAA